MSIQTLLAHVVDYAGLFPPAALDLATSAASYARYRASDERWMLGRFVVPAAKVAPLAELVPNDSAPWPLSVLAGTADAEALATADRRVRVEALELKADDPSGVTASRDLAARIGVAAPNAFVEIPSAADPAPFVEAARAVGVSLKLRTGGVTADAFPPSDVVARFMDACIRRGVAFKLTAGLHHAVRGEFPLTYEPGCPRGTMHGFLNALAAASALAAGASPVDAARLLDARDASAFRDASSDARRFLVSFGSCSFDEPVADLTALGLLPA